MVDERGQLYTIEGISAGLIMIATALIVAGGQGVFTPGTEHITDMQLEQLGSDVLALMDIPGFDRGPSDLESIVQDYDGTLFHDLYLSNLTALADGTADGNIHMNAAVFYRAAGGVKEYTLSDTDLYTGRDPAVRVTRWVQVDWSGGKKPAGAPGDARQAVQAVLVEVLIWRG